MKIYIFHINEKALKSCNHDIECSICTKYCENTHSSMSLFCIMSKVMYKMLQYCQNCQ